MPSSYIKNRNKKWTDIINQTRFFGVVATQKVPFFLGGGGGDGAVPFWNEIGRLPKGGWTEKPSSFSRKSRGGGGYHFSSPMTCSTRVTSSLIIILKAEESIKLTTDRCSTGIWCRNRQSSRSPSTERWNLCSIKHFLIFVFTDRGKICNSLLKR